MEGETRLRSQRPGLKEGDSSKEGETRLQRGRFVYRREELSMKGEFCLKGETRLLILSSFFGLK